jgi:hypothetical protein
LSLNNGGKPENKDMTRKEEPTGAPTPDKLDRSLREDGNKTDGEVKPYPLTEEEATPNTPKSEETRADKVYSKTSAKESKDTRKNQGKETASDYNKLVHHPRKR